MTRTLVGFGPVGTVFVAFLVSPPVILYKKIGLHCLGGVQSWGKSYEKDLKCLFFRTILSIEGICDESVMELGRNY